MEKQKRQSHSGNAGWEVLLFFAMYIIAPSYFAIELHGSIPLITFSRFLLVLLGIMALWRKRDIFNLRDLQWKKMNFALTDDRFLRWGVLVFFGLMFLVHLALIPADAAEAVKALFTLVVEWFVLMWLLTLLLDTRQKLLSALKALAFASAVTAVVGIVGCVLDFNPFHYLNTVQRDMLMTTYYRLGVLRLETGFGHPVFYGAFCAIITPVHMYFLETAQCVKKKLLYGGCLTVNLVALVLSNSRGSLLAFGCLILLVVVLRIVTKSFKKFLLTYVPVGAAVLGMLLIVTALTPTGPLLLQGIFQSLVAAFTPDKNHNLSITIPQDSVVIQNGGAGQVDQAGQAGQIVDYGENAGGARSRLVQMTGILYTLARKPIFGLGSNAHMRGLVKFMYRPNEWWTSKTFDMGLVSVICQYGLAGLAAFGSLYGAIFKTLADKRYRKDKLMHFLGLSFVTYLLCLLTISSLHKTAFVLMGCIICLVNIIRKEET